jgi:hypothetical protein
MYLALATANTPTTIFAGMPTLCGVYADRAEADAYCAWENARADWSVYYVDDATGRTQVHPVGLDDAATLQLHHTDGEWHWSCVLLDSSVYAYGTDFHPTQGEAWANAFETMNELTSAEFRAAMIRNR